MNLANNELSLIFGWPKGYLQGFFGTEKCFSRSKLLSNKKREVSFSCQQIFSSHTDTSPDTGFYAQENCANFLNSHDPGFLIFNLLLATWSVFGQSNSTKNNLIVTF